MGENVEVPILVNYSGNEDPSNQNQETEKRKIDVYDALNTRQKVRENLIFSINRKFFTLIFYYSRII